MTKDKLKTIEKRINQSKKNKIISHNTSHISKLYNITIELLACVIVGLITGNFFDNLFDSKPIFSILCIVFAMIAALKSIFRQNAN